MECEEFKKKYELVFNCCPSCHEDEEMGHDHDLWFEIPYDRDWHLCCEAERAYKRKHANTSR